jgi:hypothetical protein
VLLAKNMATSSDAGRHIQCPITEDHWCFRSA